MGHKPVGRPAKSDERKLEKLLFEHTKSLRIKRNGHQEPQCVCVCTTQSTVSDRKVCRFKQWPGNQLHRGSVFLFGICATLLEPHPTRSLPGMIS